MSRTIKLTVILAFSGLVLGLTTGCATNRSQIAITATSDVAINTGGIPVKIVEVLDSRKFTVNPSNPAMESLGSAEEIANPSVTARAIARKRNSFGQALGDVTLPEGRTVAGLVTEAARTALHEKGYRVVDEKSPEHATALPLSLDVRRFWAWVRPGFWSLEMKFNADVAVTGAELVGQGAQTVLADSAMNVQGAFESNWQELIQNGVTVLVAQIKTKLRNPQDVRKP